MTQYVLGPDKWPVDSDGRRATYWELRKELVYYHTLANFVRIIGYDAQSLIDIGSAGCNYIRWFDWIPDRVSLDLSYPKTAPGIRAIRADFLKWDADKLYDVVVCSQVLEHVEDASDFAKKLLALGRRVLVSVPHNWPAGSVPSHVHDPVSQEKLDGWFQRKPSYSLVVREPFAEERLMCFYNVSGQLLNLSSVGIMSMLATRPLNKQVEP